jgi:hypothetical protein
MHSEGNMRVLSEGEAGKKGEKTNWPLQVRLAYSCGEVEKL